MKAEELRHREQNYAKHPGMSFSPPGYEMAEIFGQLATLTEQVEALSERVEALEANVSPKWIPQERCEVRSAIGAVCWLLRGHQGPHSFNYAGLTEDDLRLRNK